MFNAAAGRKPPAAVFMRMRHENGNSILGRSLICIRPVTPEELHPHASHFARNRPGWPGNGLCQPCEQL